MGNRGTNIYIDMDDYFILNITSNKHGEFNLIIDKDDYEKCNKYIWSINKYGRKKDKKPYYYANNSEVGLIHRFITSAEKGMIADHISGDTLDNRNQNLRVCTKSENNWNRHFEGRNKSGKIGVFLNDKLKTPKWMSYISVDGKRKHLGFFIRYEDAVQAREDAEKKYFGDFKSSTNA